MKDIIWTLIIVWLIYKVVGIFRLGKKEAGHINSKNPDGPRVFHAEKNAKPDPAVKHKTLDSEGEYVDFEEVK